MSDKTCHSKQDINSIVHQLNSGHGDAASKILAECTVKRWNADPQVKEAANAVREAEKNSGNHENDFVSNLKLRLPVADAEGKVSSKLINEVKQAQASTADKHLCKLEIDEQGAPQIKKTADCHVTEYKYKFDKNGDFVQVKDMP